MGLIPLMLFCGFDLNEDIPDETTICRFRNKLIQKNLIDKLLKEINNQLELQNLKLKKADMAIVDATIIESNARPTNTVLEEKMAEDRAEDEVEEEMEDETKKEAKKEKEDENNDKLRGIDCLVFWRPVRWMNL